MLVKKSTKPCCDSKISRLTRGVDTFVRVDLVGDFLVVVFLVVVDLAGDVLVDGVLDDLRRPFA